jgi:N-acetylglucosamine-6-phosphate deacetylase
MQLVNAKLVLAEEVRGGSLEVRNGIIQKVSRTENPRPGKQVFDLKGGFLAPGFIDMHIHGAVGHDTMEATETAFRAITDFHLRGGTTSLTLTTLTAPAADILKVCDAARPLRGQSIGGSRILGLHIEGPFISPDKAGAQDPAHIRDPQVAEYRKYLKYGPLICQMTIAPERRGALQLIRELRTNGTVASGGHTNAEEPVLHEAVKAGMNQATHTFNAMSGVVKRGPHRSPGMIEFSLAEDAVVCELIGDGLHVPPTMMKLLFRAKGPDKVCLVTDATAGAGLKVGTEFHLFSVHAKVTKDGAVLVDGSGLAGSTLTMIEAVRRSVQLAGLPLHYAVRMASLNPARQLGRSHELGSIEPGKRADLVWFDRDFRVKGVWLDGDVRFLA